MNLFYLICPIGLESILLTELEYKWAAHFPEQQYSISYQARGGVEIECELSNGLALNNILKTPTRILLRVKQQKCRDLPKLFNILKKINWKQYLRQENVTFTITCHKSRLIHTKKIEESATKALSAYFQANKVSQKKLLQNAPPQQVFLRFNEDLLEISLDTSGELLHKRGIEYRGKASIRETYASALLLHLLGLNSHSELTLIDPMCGSATLLIEARDFFKLNHRNFAYENWDIDRLLELKDLPSCWDLKQLLGNEIDLQVFKQLDYPSIKFTNYDALELTSNTQSVVIINPPYGKRIKIEGNKQAYFENLVKRLMSNINPTKLGIIIPQNIKMNLSYSSRLSFNQNSIKVYFYIFENV